MPEAFNCIMCGQCCQGSGGIVARRSEQEAMAGFLGLSLDDFQKRFIQNSGDKSFVRTNGRDLCVFFEPGQGCLVHPVKPATCRAWPFFRGNLMDEASFEMAREYCPGISPEVEFSEFVCQGLDYLLKQNLSQDHDSSCANALDLSRIRKI